MVEADSLAAELKQAEAAFALQRKTIDAEKQELIDDLSSVEASLTSSRASRQNIVKDIEPRILSLFDQIAKQRKGARREQRHARWLVLALPRPPAPARLPAGAAERQHPSVRQLQAHPLLGAAATADRTPDRPHVVFVCAA